MAKTGLDRAIGEPMAKDPIGKKIRRLSRGNKPRVLDLFAGCGGISLGFHASGFEIVGAIEFDPFAAKSHALNFCGHLSKEMQERHAKAHDITKISPKQYADLYDLGEVDEAVDVVVGGPPCQAFARVGRAKLREIGDHPEAFLQDPRASLYMAYLRYVMEFKPLALVMENVPDVLNFGGKNVADEVAATLTEIGYNCAYTLLNAAYYGVPQMRERMFLVAYRKELGVQPTFPKPTHWVKLPKGYEGTRQVALKNIREDLFSKPAFYVDPPEPSSNLPGAVTAEEALADLPKITTHLEGGLRRGARRFDSVTPYPKGVRPNSYGRLMREWSGFEGGEGLVDHVIRYLPRDYKIFARMQPGDQYPEAHQLSMKLFEEELKKRQRRGETLKKGTVAYKELWDEYVPPYDPGKFPNKWRKMEADQPARTLMAHLGKDSYSHIHYDSAQARTISVREAARLQSFPDGFRLAGTMNPAFKQIGNAVPALLARAIAMKIREVLAPTHSAEEGRSKKRWNNVKDSSVLQL